MPKIISIINHKGGVGKTTTTANLGAALANAGQSVLLVDLDPQGNLSQHFDVYGPEEQIADAFISGKPVTRLKIGNRLYLAPSDLRLMDAERELLQSRLAFGKLRRALTETPGIDTFDYILIDCPPSLGILTENALTASSEVIIPIEPTAFAYNGLDRIFSLIDEIQTEIGTALNVRAVILTMVDSRTSVQRHIREEIENLVGPEAICQSTISRAVALQEAAVEGKHIFEYAPGSRSAKEYLALAEEIFSLQPQV
ncbi:sporulation initiation inhibitor Soj (plasmid) [Fulvitalea axinellae]|uniref:Sporulation initiation inhibitor Soj n=1 Tax=Fulvitalea axinellae TaxID=1182444 RepID=A0AAU9CV38_9BACT|nr:sporulation initiation inhibitor Soj [Fulvitalea axinellae]